jgi:spore maturation protein CgeB
MVRPLSIAFFGSSLVSAYWNGAATYYRGILGALAARGHRIVFYEPDAYERQKHRDIDDPEWARVVVYDATDERGPLGCVEAAAGADLVVKASGVGVFDALLERAVLDMRRSGSIVAFWDVDAPATLDRVEADSADPFRSCIPRYDLILTYGGGQPVIDAYRRLGAQDCVPIYNGLDPATHSQVAPDPRFVCDLGLLANRLPDREARIEAFFLDVAAALPSRRFVLGGSGWEGKILPANVDWVGHVYTRDHNAFNASAAAILNVSRASMAKYGFSPATRIFEAAGAGACMISDVWDGIDQFFDPGREILLASSGGDVAQLVSEMTPDRAHALGQAAKSRALAEHTYARRVDTLEAALAARGA